MSVNADDMNMAKGVAQEYVDLEHQVIRQKLDLTQQNTSGEVLADSPGGSFDIGERQLDREEIAQLVAYRRYASINFLQSGFVNNNSQDLFCIVDASVGINGDLFRPVTTQESFTLNGNDFFVDSGGEIGLLDHYQVFAQPLVIGDTGEPGGGIAQTSELFVDYYNWPTGGPIVDSFDQLNCGFAAGLTIEAGSNAAECQIELRYDFYWDVAEQGRSTNPFGRPSTR